MGPTLWNTAYDGVLNLKLPEKQQSRTTLRLGHLEAKCNDAAARVQRWLSYARRDLAAQKTEAVLISARKKKMANISSSRGLNRA